VWAWCGQGEGRQADSCSEKHEEQQAAHTLSCTHIHITCPRAIPHYAANTRPSHSLIGPVVAPLGGGSHRCLVVGQSTSKGSGAGPRSLVPLNILRSTRSTAGVHIRRAHSS
jgi:hypothetical protein